VSMMATGSGVCNCVPPRSASTGSDGGGTGAVFAQAALQASGDGTNVRLRGIGFF